ncbi:S9 family peptidase [Glaciecola sp. MH2013]|nr:S9 family peptidase [Glaciecola sp. MH2013]
MLGCSPSTESENKEAESMAKVAPQEFERLKALDMPAPVAKKIAFTAEYHGKTLSDPYNWLKDQGYPEVNDQPVIDYLNQENAYFNAFLAPHSAFVDTLFEEFKGRTNDEDKSVPYVSNGYEYKRYYNKGDEYPTYSRRKLDSDTFEVYLSVPDIAKPYDYFSMGSASISPDNRYLAYAYNTNGDERYKIVIKDLVSGDMLSDEITDTSGSITFGADSETLVYGRLDDERWFTKSVNVHKLGSKQADDKVIFTENDDGFFIGFGKTSSEEYIVISSGQSDKSETYVVPANDLYATPIKMVSREQGFNNSVDHANGYFYIVTNDTHVNSRLAKVADTDPSYEKWETVIAGSDKSYLQGVALFKDFMVASIRENGIERMMVSDYKGASHDIAFPENVFSVGFNNNPEFSQDFIRLSYTSMITPNTVFDYKLADKTLETKKVQEIPSGYDKTNYRTERIMAPARDGVEVPVTLVYHKDFKKDGSQPMMLYGYGAYGSTVDPRFSTLRLSMLDRGMSYAIAHVRGSDMLGYQWYLDGKLTKRTNTFNDFVDVARHLIDEKYVAKGNISISGRSAGGELMGAVTIQAPELWSSVNLGVPFVDVLNTMLDATLPLTPPEWTEWGNPIEDPVAYDYIQSYSPYDNIEAREYPPMLVTGGLNDPRVTYWEPAKWTAKMRDLKTDDNLLVMRINMGAGHFANSGRYGRLRDYAEEYAFTLLSHGISE